MVERILPRGCKDWHEDLILAAQCRYNEALTKNYQNQDRWGEAVRYLQESRNPIYIQPSGQFAGSVKGLPSKITCNLIVQVLSAVVRGAEPVLSNGVAVVPGQSLTGPGGGPTQDQLLRDKLVRTMQYRSSSYALLAALYENYQGLGGESDMDTSLFKQLAAKYSDIPVDGNYRIPGDKGTWAAKEKLKKKFWCDERKGHRNMKFYRITQLGARVAFHIFETKFIPPDYIKVKNDHGTVTEDGIFHPNGVGAAGAAGGAGAGGKGGAGTAAYEGSGSSSSSSRKSPKNYSVGRGQVSSSSSSSSRLTDADLRLARVIRYDPVRQDPKAIEWVQQMMVDMADCDLTEEQAWNMYVPDQPEGIKSGTKAAAGSASAPYSAGSSAFVDITEGESDDEERGVQMMLFQEIEEKKAKNASASAAKKRPYNDSDNTGATSVKRAAAISSSSSNASSHRNNFIVIDDSQENDDDDDDDVEIVPSGKKKFPLFASFSNALAY